MNKKILLISSVLLTLCLITIVIFNNMDNKENNIIYNIEKNKQVINNNMITMMYETEAGSGKYTETADNTWPESGYIFNDNLSGCENGGELEYNSINNTVNLLSNSSDRCYVYFDKYDGVWIDNVVATNVTGSSVTLDVTATSENGNITTYYYALNDSEGYTEVSSNVITINDLNKLTEYKIKIYAIDNTGASSNIYELNITTTDISVPIINSVSVSNVTTSGFTLTVNATSDIPIAKYYFTIEGNGENNAGTSTTNTFTFKTLEDGTSYSLLVFAESENGVLSNKYSINAITDINRFSDYIKNKYIGQGTGGLYYHNSSLTNGANDNSYRYAGTDPDNYVCFANECTEDTLYRIIGVFGTEVKLIKSTVYGSYAWSGQNSTGSSNTWNRSALNTNILNSEYLNSLGSPWVDMISSHSWKVGGGTSSNLVYGMPQEVYSYEIGLNSSSTTYNAKIGLMYISDYAFAGSPDYWEWSVSNNPYGAQYNWLRLPSNLVNMEEWLLTRITNSSSNASYVNSDGEIGYTVVYRDYNIRPSFYLNENVSYVAGSGTQSDPYQIGI